MPRGKKSVVTSEVVVEMDKVNPVIARQQELLAHLTWMQSNKFQDVGQIEVALSQINQQV